MRGLSVLQGLCRLLASSDPHEQGATCARHKPRGHVASAACARVRERGESGRAARCPRCSLSAVRACVRLQVWQCPGAFNLKTRLTDRSSTRCIIVILPVSNQSETSFGMRVALVAVHATTCVAGGASPFRTLSARACLTPLPLPIFKMCKDSLLSAQGRPQSLHALGAALIRQNGEAV